MIQEIRPPRYKSDRKCRYPMGRKIAALKAYYEGEPGEPFICKGRRICRRAPALEQVAKRFRIGATTLRMFKCAVDQGELPELNHLRDPEQQ